MCHGIDHGWESQTEDTSCKQVGKLQISGVISGIHTKGVVDADSPCHALLTLDRREDFSGVLEGNGSFAERVGDREDVDEPAMVISTVDSRF